jgi:beta-lactamase class A
VSYSIARRRPVRMRSFSPRPTRHTPTRALAIRTPIARSSGRRPLFSRPSVLAAVVAYVLVGAFIGVAAWKLTETAVETKQLEEFERPRVDVVPPPPPAPSGPHHDLALQDLLQRNLPASGTVGLYVKHLTSGAEASVNAERVFPAASLYKLPIMAEVIRQVRLQRLSLDQQMVVSRSHWVPGSGVLQGRVGDSLPIRELLRLLIAESDNIAAMMLLDLTGLNNVNLSMQGMGLRQTRLLDYRVPGVYNSPLGPYQTTPADMATLMESIAAGRLVDPTGSEEALKLLESKQASELLADGLPWWAKVAHKWGEIPGARHEAGIVFTPRGQYVVVVMTENLDPNGSGGYIRDLSRAIFDHFEKAR